MKKDNYAIHVPDEIRRRYRGEKFKFINHLGFLIYSWKIFGRKDWFFITTDEFIEELGLSHHTIHIYNQRLVNDGLIQIRVGNFKEGRATEFHLLFDVPRKFHAKQTDSSEVTSKTAMSGSPVENNPIEKPKTATKGCTMENEVVGEGQNCHENEDKNCHENSIDSEVVVFKTAMSDSPMENEVVGEGQNCHTDIEVTDTESIVAKSTNISVRKTTLPFSDTSSEGTLVTSTSCNNSDSTGEVPVNPFTSFFSDVELKDFATLCERLPHWNREGLFTLEEIKESRKWLWSRWRQFDSKYLSMEMSFPCFEQGLEVFREWVKYCYGREDEKSYEEQLSNFDSQVGVIRRKFFMDRWDRFLAMVADNQGTGMQCHFCKEKFYAKFNEYFRDLDPEEFSKVEYALTGHYEEARNKRPAPIRVVTDLYDAGETLESALEYLSNSTLTQQEIRDEWERLSTPTDESDEEALPAPSKRRVGEGYTREQTEAYNSLITKWTRLLRAAQRKQKALPQEAINEVISMAESSVMAPEQKEAFRQTVHGDCQSVFIFQEVKPLPPVALTPLPF